jgi:small-conductance mechanosensitive channel
MISRIISLLRWRARLDCSLVIITPLRHMPDQVHSWWQLLEHWQDDAFDFARTKAPRILVVAVVAFLLIELLHMVTRRLNEFSRRQNLGPGFRSQQLRTLASIVNSVGLIVILFVAAMQILPLLSIDIGPLLASAGIVGLAIGFGAQTLVKDVINGFFILMENQFDVGDVVKISGVSGTVEHLTLRRTVLRDGDGALHNIPNSEIKVVSNLTRDWTQTALHVTASYQEDSDRVIGLLKEVGAELRRDPEYQDILVADPEVPGIERIAPGEVDYLMLIKTRPGGQHAVTRELRRRIKACFERNQVQPAVPTSVYLMNQPPAK